MKTILYVIVILQSLLHASPNLFNKNDSLSFAQLYLGIETSSNTLKAPYSNNTNTQWIQNNTNDIGIIIGGLHFWGHADFHVKFSTTKTLQNNSITAKYNPGIETTARYYPSQLTQNKWRPYAGIGFLISNYEQYQGPKKDNISFPLQIGMTYTFNTFLFDIGCRYNAHSSINQYYTSETQQHTININNLSTQFRLSWFTDTTKLTRYHPKNSKPKMSHFFIGAGPSSTWKSTKTNNTDILDLGQNLIIMPEITMGFEKTLDKNTPYKRRFIQLAYRPQEMTQHGYSKHATYSNHSIAIEIAQSFANYHGFIPYIGGSMALNHYKYKQDSTNTQIKAIPGILIGWDIVPDLSIPIFLRTNLRLYPTTTLTDSNNIKRTFPNFEFNFIQMIVRF